MRPRHPHPWHRGSVEIDPIAEPRSPDFIAKWRDMLEAEADDARRFGHRMAHALAALIGFLGPDGRCFPAMSKVAEVAGVCRRTVDEAIRRAAELGYLVVIRRTEALPDGRIVQASNAYAFRLPLAAVPGKVLGLAWRKGWWARLKARRSVRRLCAPTAELDSFPTATTLGAPSKQGRSAQEEERWNRVASLAALAQVRNDRQATLEATWTARNRREPPIRGG